MKVLFDHQAFTFQLHGGVSRCFAELYRNMPNDVKTHFSLLESDNVYAHELGIGHPANYYHDSFLLPWHYPYKGRLFRAYNRLNGFKGDYNDKSLYNRHNTIKLLKKSDFDVFHPTFFEDYFLPFLNGKPFVLTIHDMIPELYPQYYARDDMQISGKRKLAHLASAIIAVSENTRNDIVRILGVPEEKVHVIYHGSEHIHGTGLKNHDLSLLPIVDGTYILYVGDRYGYKDFDLFVEVVAPVLIKHPELNVVCTGWDFNNEEQMHFEHLSVKNRFIHIRVKNDEELYQLYHNAVCFVYPSEYEGFGIPILEAYKADCPVMLNKASCFPEIAGDAAVYFKLCQDDSDFAEKFDELYTMTAIQKEELLSKQRNRLSIYSWKQSARQLADVYKQVLG